MKIVLELKNTPKKDDILVFDGKHFECVSKASVLKEINDKLSEVDTALSNIDSTLQQHTEDINLLKGEE